MPQHPHQLESAVEAYLTRRVRAIGGASFKLAPTHAGLPDRLLFMPGGLVYFVEVKAIGGAVSPIQHLVHERLRKLGTHVYVVWGNQGVDDFMREHFDRACVL
jgi:hypothetical protein